MNRDVAMEEYLEEAASWDADSRAAERRVTRVAWLVAIGGWLCVIALGIALMLLMPLKRVEPYVIRVDNRSGIVDVVPVYADHATLPESVTRYFLDHYVTTCERFNFSTAESDYEECGAFHTPARNQVWAGRWARTNPQSPLNLYKDGTTLRVQVNSISFFTRGNGTTDLAQVRYSQLKRTAGSSDEQATHWIATVQYTYVDPAKDVKTRHWNPLGFRIVEFQSQPEVGGETQLALSTEAAP